MYDFHVNIIFYVKTNAYNKFNILIGERPSSFETMKYSRDVISMVLFLYETFNAYIHVLLYCSGFRENCSMNRTS